MRDVNVTRVGPVAFLLVLAALLSGNASAQDGADTTILTTGDGGAGLRVEVRCDGERCSDAKRDALAEQVAATARASP